MSQDILSRIAEYKREDVASRKARTSRAELEAAATAADAPRGFHRALAARRAPGGWP